MPQCIARHLCHSDEPYNSYSTVYACFRNALIVLPDSRVPCVSCIMWEREVPPPPCMMHTQCTLFLQLNAARAVCLCGLVRRIGPIMGGGGSEPSDRELLSWPLPHWHVCGVPVYPPTPYVSNGMCVGVRVRVACARVRVRVGVCVCACVCVHVRVTSWVNKLLRTPPCSTLQCGVVSVTRAVGAAHPRHRAGHGHTMSHHVTKPAYMLTT